MKLKSSLGSNSLIVRQLCTYTILFIQLGKSLGEFGIQLFFAPLSLGHNVYLVQMFFKLLGAQVFIFLAKLLIKFNLWVVRQVIANLNASILSSQSQRCSQILNDSLIEVAFVDED